MFKRITLLTLALTFATTTAFAAFAAPANPDPSAILVDPALAAMFAKDGEQITTEDFLALTPRKIRKATGERLGLKKAVALKVAQKAVKRQIKQEAKNGAPAGDGSKSQIVALVLAIVLGGLGIHRFYLGYTLIGIIQIVLALTSFLIVPGIALLAWVLVDIIRIATGGLEPKNGAGYDPSF